MTPEERARMLRHWVCTHYRPGIGAVIGPTSGEFFCEKCVAHEIRAAENEALEMAAKVADQERDENDGRSDPAWCAANAIGDTIRSLKSKESKP